MNNSDIIHDCLRGVRGCATDEQYQEAGAKIEKYLEAKWDAAVATKMDSYIAVQECAEGNAAVGTAWLETKSFSPATTLSDVWQWRLSLPVIGNGGRLMITLERK